MWRKISSLCNHREASPQWTHFLSNSTIYYLMAIIYSDRITVQNMTFFSLLHFTFDDSLYEFFLITEYEIQNLRWTWPLQTWILSIPIFFTYFSKEELNKCKNQQISLFSPLSFIIWRLHCAYLMQCCWWKLVITLEFHAATMLCSLLKSSCHICRYLIVSASQKTMLCATSSKLKATELKAREKCVQFQSTFHILVDFFVILFFQHHIYPM